MLFQTVLYPSDESVGFDDVRWETPNKKVVGFGYRDKSTYMIHVQRCPNCHNENYMAQICCVVCGFNPNPKNMKIQPAIAG